MIIVYSEKPFVTQKIAPILSLKYPEEQVVYIHPHYFANVYFSYPQNIKWKDFPYITETRFDIKELSYWKPMALVNNKVVPIDIEVKKILNARKIIYAAEMFPNNCYWFSVFLEKAFQENKKDLTIDYLFLMSLADEDLKKNIESIHENRNLDISSLINSGKIQKYFDYNYNFNSFALLDKVVRYFNKMCGDNVVSYNSSGNIFISKNMLQLLYFIRKEEDSGLIYSLSGLLNKMSNWSGTRKYPNKIRLGNMASSSVIIENLIALKLIKYGGNHTMVMTEKGKMLLDFLPKDTDLDIPFRIKQWSQMPFEESKPKIDKYLFTYFQKIKNKLKSIE